MSVAPWYEIFYRQGGRRFRDLMSNIKQPKHLEHLEDEMLNYGRWMYGSSVFLERTS